MQYIEISMGGGGKKKVATTTTTTGGKRFQRCLYEVAKATDDRYTFRQGSSKSVITNWGRKNTAQGYPTL